MLGLKSLGMTGLNFDPLEPVTDGTSYFGFIHLHELKKHEELLKDRKLNYRDITVLLLMMGRCNAKTGKVKFIVKKFAEDISMNATSLSACIANLKKAMLIATFIEEDGEKYYMINPYIFSVGKKQRWGFCVQKFFSAFE